MTPADRRAVLFAALWLIAVIALIAIFDIDLSEPRLPNQ